MIGIKLTEEQYAKIADCFPRHRGNVGLDNLSVLNAILYISENGGKWRRLPEEFGNRHTIYSRMRRWAKSGTLNKVFTRLQQEQLIHIRIDAVSLDSSYIKVHPDACGALKKTEPNALAGQEADGRVNFIWSPQILNVLQPSR